MINKQMIQDFRKDFTEAVKDLEKKYGVVIELGNIQYAADNFEAKLQVTEGEDQYDVNRKAFIRNCGAYGLNQEDFDRRFTYKNKEYVIIGINPNKRKYPIACKCLTDNITYNFPIDLLKRYLNSI